ncbi:MAG: dTDP-4-dehydrorhamnose reductase [Candidatus Gracilibacteria bacterium]|nr:dTDP-4-dehydrorhamnose reductase [Candidatus Gracilibacteria bacterium]
MKTILLTGSNGMLATDFVKYCGNDFKIHAFDKHNLDITNIEEIEKIISEIKPDIVLNCAAYTAVDDAEDIGKLKNYEINTIGVYNLAKITNRYNMYFITISTDYVFDGENKNGYSENANCNPINEYGMSKYLAEKLALSENINTIIIRTSWLYGGGKQFKNFVNTMLKLSETRNELKVVNDQFGIPTYTKDLSFAIKETIEKINNLKGTILHFSNSSDKPITWFDFASEVFKLSGKNISLIPCISSEFITKAKRPNFSSLINNSDIKLRNWKEGISDYIDNL